MSCISFPIQSLNEAIGKGFLAKDAIKQVFNRRRFNFPYDFVPFYIDILGLDGGPGYHIPSSANALRSFLEDADNSLLLDYIPDDWYNQEYNYKSEATEELQDIQRARDFSQEAKQVLENASIDCKNQGYCWEKTRVDALINGLGKAETTLTKSLDWEIWKPFFGTSNIFGIPTTGDTTAFFTISESAYRDIQSQETELSIALGYIEQFLTIDSLKYDCNKDPDNTPDNGDCEALIEAINGIDLTCPEVNLQPIIDEIRAIEIPECPEIPEIDYNRIITGVFDRVRDYLDPKFPTLSGNIPYTEACGLGVSSSEPFDGEAFRGLQSAIEALGRQNQAIQQNLCNYTDTKGNNVRTSLTEEIRRIDIPECPEIPEPPEFDYDRITNHITNEVQGIDIPECPEIPEPPEFDYDRITNHIDSKFPNLGGAIAVKTCEGKPVQEFLYDGEGFRGLESQNKAVAKALESVSQELCEQVNIPIIVMPDDGKQDFTVSSQLQITFVPVSERDNYNSRTPPWRINVPNPIDGLDWCTHIEPLLWQRGKGFFGRTRWQRRGTWTGGYFANRDNALYIMNQLIQLSKSPVLDNPPRITENPSARREVRRVDVIPLRANITNFDNDGNPTDVLCLKPPYEGCS